MIPQDRFRSLFHKYLVALFVAVAIPLAFNGIIEGWFGYRDQRARLDQWLGLQSASAAAEIHDFIHGVTTQLGWLVQLPWTEEPDERRRTDALRLLRQAPAITSLTLLDGNGLERLYISRIGLNRIESRADRSADPALAGARLAQVWFSEVSYNRGSEPYLTVSIVGNRPAVGAVVAEVNLKLIWDVISAIKFGKTGYAFVLDRSGRLVAHPDISLVLRGAEEATSEPFRALRDAIGPGRGFATSRDAQGHYVAASAAPIQGPDWTVVVEQPLSEAYAPLYAALWRTVMLLAMSSILAGILAYVLADRMTVPIKLLEEGTERIGAGSFDHRISIHTRDEFQRLANSFNRMASELEQAQQHQERIAKLKRFLAPQVADLVDRAGDDSVLDGRRTEVVVVFCDLRGFTAFSAGAAPEEVMSVLSEYYETLGRVIAEFEATLINFSGDGLMVLVNAPVPIEEPALRAIDLAVDMQKNVQALITGWRSHGYHVGFGVGLASGPATVGRIGYKDRLDYTAIGSVVNLAARLCASAADKEILIDAEVASAAKGKRHLEELGDRKIKGFDEAIPIFGISFSRL
ncbi:adenylate/guanylate cyclase domain-containing protein [Bradyrhizobium canariense]|uniref:adenylate/guanylate cyclase domain-containing protein n=1 Tax=Bradyrhizobium canariense TaxID=255045 RepID=UPI000A18FF0B|nr:adenylate/guanylate cyclase domain-containing protein [Bradyrhizobium canariense]OSI35093.1 adenylate/guanylate cyclase domain-containing protein [Bradyrhizobium canariense]OSI40017.1 adenylate/guanylate cyclase domain-containing protein [Bradyrhizobium canariense]OSI54894.1 adenylate/guanylate cyclase domain-containing protein [Bradyrhizobium canariense]OSI57314.1 adenylate/guanylate cyclase domain-containing protein [Bradyrhizobium canariense]OSI59885.1 adenylate/guanylate cyclase domain-